MNGIERGNTQELQLAKLEVREVSNEFLQRDKKSDPFNINNLLNTAVEVEFDPSLDYIISPVDSSNKFTNGLSNCTSLVVMGTESASGENISFQTHQSDPVPSSEFYTKLAEKLTEIGSRCVPGTVDAVVAGGRVTHPVRTRAYQNTISIIAKAVEDKFGFTSCTIVAPKTNVTKDDLVYCDTKNKIVYVVK